MSSFVRIDLKYEAHPQLVYCICVRRGSQRTTRLSVNADKVDSSQVRQGNRNQEQKDKGEEEEDDSGNVKSTSSTRHCNLDLVLLALGHDWDFKSGEGVKDRMDVKTK